MTVAWDHSSYEQFVDYYAAQSARPEFANRFRSIRDAVLRFHRSQGQESSRLDVLDVGCNAGTHCMVWAEKGHLVHGVDVNEPLVNLARERTAVAGYGIDLRLGSADHLPWPDASMDVCLAIELLEHVEPWQSCLTEFARVLRPGGILFLTTTNSLCPVQSEFNLPAYSWYPARLKRHFEKLSVTSRPALANYAKYPAVNWFSPYSLGRMLKELGFAPHDRFDLADSSTKGLMVRTAITLVRNVPMLRWFAHVCREGTLILAVKE